MASRTKAPAGFAAGDSLPWLGGRPAWEALTRRPAWMIASGGAVYVSSPLARGRMVTAAVVPLPAGVYVPEEGMVVRAAEVGEKAAADEMPRTPADPEAAAREAATVTADFSPESGLSLYSELNLVLNLCKEMRNFPPDEWLDDLIDSFGDFRVTVSPASIVADGKLPADRPFGSQTRIRMYYYPPAR